MDTYEKKYKESLELARDYYKANLKLDKADENFILEDIFPELKESEDERIRKAIIELVKQSSEVLNEQNQKDILAWLEKQGEKKPFDYENANIKQKDFAPKIEPFDKYEGLTDFERTLADICIGWIGQELGWKQYIKDNADVLLKIAIKMFNSVQDAPFEQKPTDNDMVEELRTEYEKGKADAFAEMQKEWSEEDEEKFRDVIRLIEQGAPVQSMRDHYTNWLKSLKDRVVPQSKQEWSKGDMDMLNAAILFVERSSFTIIGKGKNNTIAWLKSLKSRVIPQSKQEWSEEDEDYFDAIITKLKVTQEDAALTDNQLKFLKSLKYKVFPQNHWKPSDEQMEALDNFIFAKYPNIEKYEKSVKLLYNDLKKLKGE